MSKFCAIILLVLSSCRAHKNDSENSSTFNVNNEFSRLKSSVSGRKAPVGKIPGVIISVTVTRLGAKDDLASDTIGDIIMKSVLASLRAKKQMFTVVAINAESALKGYSSIREKITAEKDAKILRVRKKIEESGIQDIDTQDDPQNSYF